MLTISAASCDFIKGKSSDATDNDNEQTAAQAKPQYDLDTCRQLLKTAEYGELTDVQINQLIDQLDGLLNYVNERTATIAAMPAGQPKCDAFNELKTSREVGATSLAYNTINTADRQKGFNNSIGQRIKALNAPARMKAIIALSDSIYAQCH